MINSRVRTSKSTTNTQSPCHHSHLVHCERTSLIGAYSRRIAHRFARAQHPYQIAVLQHPCHSESQRQSDCERQPLRNRNNNYRDANNHDLQEILRLLSGLFLVSFQLDEEFDEEHNEEEKSNDTTKYCNLFSHDGQLRLQWRRSRFGITG